MQYLKRLMILLLCLMLAAATASAGTIVTSFYPVYLITLNLTNGLPDTTVTNLAAPGTGCLHDYQLQISDMKVLAKADAFVICGAGMESYLTMIFNSFPALPVVDSSEGITLLEETEEEVENGHAHDHESVNAHIWLSAANTMQMAENIAEGLIAVLPEQAEAIRTNLAAYLERLSALDQELQEALSHVSRKDIITFHEAFPYFAEAYGLHVAAVVNREPGDALSPAQLARLVGQVKALGNPPLFIEPQYDDMAARTLANETEAPVYTLDPCVTGPETDIPLDYYEQVMRQNAATLLEALQ